VLYEVRVASVHSETITELALAATQTAYTETGTCCHTDWFFHIAKPSYARAGMIAHPVPRLACHGAITPNTVARSLHADDCSIARALPNPHQHGYAGISITHSEKGEQALQQPIYLKGLQVTPEQDKSLFETGSYLNEAVSQAMKANPAAVHAHDVKLVLASCLIRQHKAITNVPMVSSLADLRAEHCDFLINSDSLYTPCQTPYCSGTCMCTEMLQCHRPYYDDTNLTLSVL